MFYKKIIYYRKKKMMSQEQLAEALHVSRQTITKWETGVSLPNLEYLMDLSQLFGVTIDSLVKDDDCKSEREEVHNVDELSTFLVEAKKHTYAAKHGKIDMVRLGSTDYQYVEGKYKYIDSFVGSSSFSGQEVVYKNEQAIWSMNYYGRVLEDSFDGDFLKEALLRVPLEKPYRGEESFVKGDFIYHSKVEGKISYFIGREEIFYQNKMVYECVYHGGTLR